jgi:hypothetical protein
MEDEVVVRAAVAATAAMSVAAWRGIAWAVEAATNLDLRPASRTRFPR